MSKPVISVQNLSKIYKLYDDPMCRLKEAVHPFRKSYHRDFYALRELNFQINEGETVGIIGKNGSGKSTLLKIITGVLTPSQGNIDVSGSVSALLELGAGFNTEMTGIENVYFNGTIMGYTKGQMDEKLDDILAFADIGEFAEQPVKTYSSGMFVRLAFALSVSINPDILIVDEALSVGDVRFQSKCMRRMREFHEQGKTFLFVSHSLDVINNFCKRTIWLKDGSICEDGQSKTVTQDYYSYMTYNEVPMTVPEASLPGENIAHNIKSRQKEEIFWEDVSKLSSIGEGGCEVKNVAFHKYNYLEKKLEEPVKIIEGGEWLAYYVYIVCHEELSSPIINVDFMNSLGNLIFGLNTYFMNYRDISFKAGQTAIMRFIFKMPKLKNGNYMIHTGVSDGFYMTATTQHCVFDSYLFQILNKDLACNHYYTVLENVEFEYQAKD